jgi:hypothetical protein
MQQSRHTRPPRARASVAAFIARAIHLFDLAKHLVVMFLRESTAIAGAIVFESLVAQFRAANLAQERAVRVVSLRRVEATEFRFPSFIVCPQHLPETSTCAKR